ncbi:hypothetical protein EDD85DRAFT_953486 [Armillaria nabsnona]|nr:hypothetical protein EDD85DRAFT_953486 [Armillaria nabsnona]
MPPSTTLHIVPGTSKAPPRFTEGPVSLALYEDYSEHCHVYLCEHHKKVTDDAVVPKIISGFGSTWALDQAQRVKAMRQNGLPLKQWFVNVFAASHILTGLPEEIKDAKLITFLINAMDAGLRTSLTTETHELSNKIKAGTANNTNGETFAKWRLLVNKADEKIQENNVRLLEMVCSQLPGFSQTLPANEFQSNTPSSSYHTLPTASSFTAAIVPLFSPAFSNQNLNFITAVAAQCHCLSSEELFTLAELAHGCLKCLMPFQNHISRSGLCDSPAVTPGMPSHQPCDVKWVNEWMCLNPAGFKNCNTGAPSAAARIPYTITQDTI